MQKYIQVVHECFESCPKCYGSGEGMYDGSRGCTQCKGSGRLWDRGDKEDDYIVEWYEEDLSDLEIFDGSYARCDYCGQDMLEIAREELKWRIKDGISI